MANPLEAKVTLIDGMHFRAESGSGFSFPLDAAEDVGGRNRGGRPMEMLLMGLGACTAMDVISILRKMQQEVTAYEIDVHGDRADTHPKVYTDIVVEHRVSGRDLAPDRVRRAVELSATKYCSASAMLSRAASVRHDYVLVDADTGKEVDRGTIQE